LNALKTVPKEPDPIAFPRFHLRPCPQAGDTLLKLEEGDNARRHLDAEAAVLRVDKSSDGVCNGVCSNDDDVSTELKLIVLQRRSRRSFGVERSRTNVAVGGLGALPLQPTLASRLCRLSMVESS
jgi:hypothetical protein